MSISWNIHEQYKILCKKKYKELIKRNEWNKNSFVGFWLELEAKWFFNSSLSNKIKIIKCVSLNEIFSKYEQYQWDAINKIDCFVYDKDNNIYPVNIKTCVTPKTNDIEQEISENIFISNNGSNVKRYNSLIPHFVAFLRIFDKKIHFEGFMYNNIIDKIEDDQKYDQYFTINKEKYVSYDIENANMKALKLMYDNNIILTNLTQINNIL